MMAGAIWYALNTQGELSLAQLKKLVEGEGPHFRLGHRVASARGQDRNKP